MSAGSAARMAAYELLTAVDTDDAYANLTLPEIIASKKLVSRDAAFATELGYGALRMRGLYEAIIADASGRPIKKIDPQARRVLALGAHQSLAMRVAAHAAVSETVALAKLVAPRGAGFVNAVMRRVSERTRDEWLTRVAGEATPESVALKYSHPAWVAREIGESLSHHGRQGELEAALDANNEPSAVTLVIRPGLADQDILADSNATATALAPTASTLGGGDPSRVPGFQSGLVAVQDEGSQLVALALAAAHLEPSADGERWLDMCSGPGGKASLLGALAAQRGATVDALELHEHRAALVRKAARAIPDGVVSVHVTDARRWAQDGYDRVLVDAPCTGLGALRRRPEARWRRSEQDLAHLTELQASLLRKAMLAVRPGGVVAYVTCSPVLAETVQLVDSVVLELGPTRTEVLDARSALRAAARPGGHDWGVGPYVQMWPHAHGTDAMFMALIRRPSATPDAQ